MDKPESISGARIARPENCPRVFAPPPLHESAHQNGIDLGTLHKTNLRYAFPGNAAERVVSDGPCSVLAILPAA